MRSDNREDPRRSGERPSALVAVDVVLLTVIDGQLQVCLIRRAKEPYYGLWSVPGVFMRPELDSSFVDTARRAVEEKVGVKGSQEFQQLLSWHNPSSDPRGWVVSIVHYAVQRPDQLATALNNDNVVLATLQSDSQRVRATNSSNQILRLAFDHDAILARSVAQLRLDAERSDIALNALPSTFTLRQLQVVHEAIYGKPVNKDSFRRSVTRSRNLVVPANTWQDEVGHRPAQLYMRNSTSPPQSAGPK